MVDQGVAPFDPREAFWLLEAVPQAAAPDRALLCEVGTMRFAVPITYLRGVEPYESVAPLPRVPAWVVGVTNVRGTVVGVVDLGRFLGAAETAPGRGRLMICGAGPRLVALAVHATPTVLDYSPTTLMDAVGVSGRVGRYVAGLVPTDGTAVPLLDVGRLLADDELVRG